MRSVLRFGMFTALCCALLFMVTPAALAESSANADSGIVLPPRAGDVAGRLTDGNPNSRVSVQRGEQVVLMPAADACALLLMWYEAPESVSVSQQGTAGDALNEQTAADLLETVIDLDPGCGTVTLTAEQSFTLSEIVWLDAAARAARPDTTRPEKVDLMVVAAHAGDETLYFGSVLPAYAAEECMETLTVCLSHFSPAAQHEAIAAQLTYGESNEPLFFDLRHRLITSADYANGPQYWPQKKAVELLVAAIRQYRPEVIVTNAADGEGHEGTHAWTAELTRLAVEAAASESYYKNSARTYGVWQVKKLYFHAGEGASSPTVVDPARALHAFAGESALERAEKALTGYRSLDIYRMTPAVDGAYALVFSTVGEDTARDDLFENISAAELTNAAVAKPTPAPAATPEATLLPEETTAPATQGAVTPVPAALETVAPDLRLIVLAGGAVLTALLFALLFRRFRKKRSLMFSILPCALPLLFAAIAALVLTLTGTGNAGGAAPGPTLVPAAAEPETPTETSAISPEPTETPEAAETPAPSETEPPAGDASYFRGADEPEETVVSDEEAGHWEYRSDALSILIDRHSADLDGPVVWYTAHIRMRDYDSFRAGFGNMNLRGSAKNKPWIIARKYRAILAITGDNLINNEQNLKGILIRDGYIYSEMNAQPTLALYSDRTMRIHQPRTVTAQELIDDGVRNTFGFGPILVMDGKIYEEGYRTTINGRNPRCGLGYVEPGHFVAIVVDGRQKDYSLGLTIDPFSQLFLDEGCTLAFNMDGGASAGMVFMGENINQHRQAGSRDHQRSWPDALLWGYSTSVPTPEDPIYNPGNLNQKVDRP